MQRVCLLHTSISAANYICLPNYRGHDAAANNQQQHSSHSMHIIHIVYTVHSSCIQYYVPARASFQGPPLPKSNAPRNDVAPLKIITYRAIKTTGTLIVNISARKLYCNKNIFCVDQHTDFL
jgi:hypothetical protein